MLLRGEASALCRSFLTDLFFILAAIWVDFFSLPPADAAELFIARTLVWRRRILPPDRSSARVPFDPTFLV